MIEQSDNLNELGAALAKAQAEIKSAIKDATNPHFKSRYADLPAIVDASRAALTANGIAVVQLPQCGGEPRQVTVATMLLHSSGQWIRAHTSATPKDFSPQSVGSAITYLRRYGLASMVGIVADDDDDGNAAQPSEPATDAQLRRIGAICEALEKDADKASQHFCQVPFHSLTKSQASRVIEGLEGLKR